MAIGGVTWQARPTTYQGIPMRSRLEATMAAHLDRYGYEWRYESRAFAGTHGQYLPDFELFIDGGLRSVVEIKGEQLSDEAFGDALRRMRIVWESEPEAYLWLIEAEAIRSGYFRRIGLPRATFIVQTPWMPEGAFVWGALGLCDCGSVGLRFVWRGEDDGLQVAGGCRGCGALDGTLRAYLDPTEYRA